MTPWLCSFSNTLCYLGAKPQNFDPQEASHRYGWIHEHSQSRSEVLVTIFYFQEGLNSYHYLFTPKKSKRSNLWNSLISSILHSKQQLSLPFKGRKQQHHHHHGRYGPKYTLHSYAWHNLGAVWCSFVFLSWQKIKVWDMNFPTLG